MEENTRTELSSASEIFLAHHGNVINHGLTAEERLTTSTTV